MSKYKNFESKLAADQIEGQPVQEATNDAEEQTTENGPKSEVSGREIRGLEPKLEKFSRLEEGTDFKLSWVNPEIDSSADPRDDVLFVNPTGGDQELMIVPPNWRTVSAPAEASIKKDDGEDEYFFTANTKGVGYLKPFVKGGNLDDFDSWVDYDFIEGERILGLNTDRPGIKSSENQMAISNKLIKAGLRLEAHWAKAELLRIPYRGEMRTIEELQEIGLFPRKFSDKNRLVRPMELVRLLKTNSRIEESLLADDRREKIFEEAFETFNREARLAGEPELAIGDRRQEQEFFKTFSRRIGANLAVMLNEGYTHGALHSSNVSMAAEFVDIDPLNYWSDDKIKSGWKEKHDGLRLHHIKDIRDSIYSLRRLYKAARLAGLSIGSRATLAENLISGFDDLFDEEKAKAHEIDGASARQWLGKIAEHVLVKRQNLSSLMHYHISEWEI